MEENVVELIWNYEFVPIDCQQRAEFINRIITLCLNHTDDSYELHTAEQFDVLCNKLFKTYDEAYKAIRDKMDINLKKIDNSIINELDENKKNIYTLLAVSYKYYKIHLLNQLDAYKIRSTVMQSNENNK